MTNQIRCVIISLEKKDVRQRTAAIFRGCASPADKRGRNEIMDNNNNNNNNEHECPGGEYEYFGNSRSQGDYDRPRKRVSRETLRKRQFGALCVIALIVLILIIIMAKACTKDNPKKGGDTKPPASVSTTSGTGTASDISYNDHSADSQRRP